MHRPLALLLLTACSSEPAGIRVADTVPVYDQSFVNLGAVAVDEKGEVLDDPVKAVEVSNPDMLALGNNGELQCRQYGDATAVLQVGSIRKEVVVRCQLIREIRVAPKEITFVLQPDPSGVIHPSSSDPLVADAIGPTGEVIEGANITFSSSDPSVARIEGDRVVKVRKRGQAIIKVTAGDKVVEVPVRVSQEVLDRRGLVVEDGQTHGIPLEAGLYKVAVGSDEPVAVAFQGADCESEKSIAHGLDCALEQAGTLRIENPAILGLGSGPARVNVRVIQLP